MVKENKKIINLFIFVSILVFILIYRFIILKYFLIYSEAITASFMMVLTASASLLYGFRKHNNIKWNEKFFKATLFVVILYFIIIYLLGIATGYLKNSYSLTFNAIIDNMIYPVIIIICAEISRYTFIKGNKNNMPMIILFTLLLAILDINCNLRFEGLTTFNAIFEAATVTIIPILLRNIVCSYSSYYSDYKPALLYRGFIELYIYIAPIQPNLDKLMLSISQLMLPFMLLLLYSGTIETDNETYNKNKKFIKLSDVPLYLLMVLITCVVFGIGPFKMVGIKTGSMTPKYNIGDAVIVDKNVDREELKVGDVIAYWNKDNELIVHRIVNINMDGSFITKGDYNNTTDSGYIKKDQVFGVVRFKIPWIAYPSLIFRK